MRLSQDDSSWKARGILRRDFRHTHGEPEIPKTKVRKKNKPRKRIDHKHDWVEATEYYEYRSSLGPDYPRWSLHFRCTICRAHKWKKNPRYGYESYKYRKNKK